MRIGFGYDVHKLAEGYDLVLGGVKIPHHAGLLGHSDADVLIHSIMDALLGAAGLGDIGCMFPDSDMRYKGISSLKLLAEVMIALSENGFEVVNIDSTIVCQAPKLSPFFPEMTEHIANILEIPSTSVNIKATTEEGLGFTGKKEGVASYAVCIIE